mgnify:CR=1 FL=1
MAFWYQNPILKRWIIFQNPRQNYTILTVKANIYPTIFTIEHVFSMFYGFRKAILENEVLY